MLPGMKTIVLTGHRTLQGEHYPRPPWTGVGELAQAMFRKYLERHGEARLITGMALGWDQVATRAAMVVGGFHIHAFVPFRGQEGRWPPASRARYLNLLEQCDKITYLKDKSPPDRRIAGKWLLERNYAMLRETENDDLLFSLWNRRTTQGSGTWRTIQAAKEMRDDFLPGMRGGNLYWVNLNPDTMKLEPGDFSHWRHP